MKPLALWISCITALFLLSCGESEKVRSEPFTARIIATSSTGYHLQNVTFQTLRNVTHLEGDYGNILGNAALDADAGIEEIIKSEAKDNLYIEKGKRVRIDFTVKDGVIHPKNFDSMAMMAMYYNYEQTILFWRDQMGLDLDDFGSLRLFYAPRIKRRVSGGSFEGTVKVNAAFLPGPRDLFFFKTSPIELVPINMNFGVMAHEYSHAIFDYQFADKNPAIYSSRYSQSETRLRAINEGVADYFSYMITQRVEEFGDSLDSLRDFRTLPISWTLATIQNSGCRSGAYCEGSLIASALYEIANSPGEDAISVGQHVFRALKTLAADWYTYGDTLDFNYHFLLNRILNEVATQSGNITLYCEKFTHYFNTKEMKGKLTRCSS